MGFQYSWESYENSKISENNQGNSKIFMYLESKNK